MTQKELLYVEDAINHEQNIMGICENIVDTLEDDDIISFFEKEIKKHNNMHKKLIDLLKENVNE